MYLTKLALTNDLTKTVFQKDQIAIAHSKISDSLKTGIKKPTRYLWDLDLDRQQLIILSHIKPQVKLLSDFGNPDQAVIKSYRVPIDDRLMDFKLVANPSKRLHKNGYIIQLDTPKEQLAWLKRKATANGFYIENVKIKQTEKMVLQHNNLKPTKLVKTTFVGQLHIINRLDFKRALVNGIGREKAYGMGLLQIKPTKKATN